MNLDSLVEKMQEKVASAPVLGKILKLDFGDEQVSIDGSGERNKVVRENIEADCTISVSKENFMKLVSGDLNPMGAVMSGKIKIKGDMALAMKMQSLF